MRLSVIIPTYNRPKDLKNCLESISKQTVLPYEVIVIDDNSKVDLKPIIKHFIKKLRIIYRKNKKNMRQSYSKNCGAKIARGDILLFIDDDCVADKYWIAHILKNFNNDNSIVVVGGRIYNLGGRKDIVDIIFSLPKYFFFKQFNKTGRILPTSQTTAKFERDGRFLVDWVSAGNMAILKREFLSVGGFDTRYLKGHCAFEEPDLCFRIAKMTGKKILYDSKMICHHKFSSTGRDTNIYGEKYFSSYNQMLFFLKNEIFKKRGYFLPFVFYTAGQIICSALVSVFNKNYLGVAKGKIKCIEDYFKGYIDSREMSK